MPEVSVIVPNYNHSRFLKQRIDSILAQSFEDIELIILDDCSTDDSKTIIESYRQNSKVAAIVYNTNNSGSAFAQWKKGLSLATGKYIWIAESDDFVTLNFLDVGLRSIARDGSQIFFCKSVQVDENGGFLRDLHWWLDDLSKDKWNNSYTCPAVGELRDYLIKRNFICNASSVIFLKSPEVIGYLGNVQRYKYCGDWLFWLQVLKHARTVSYSIDATNFWRDHPSTTRAFISYDRNFEMMKVYKWVVKNVLKKESFELLKYYYKFHINKKPRSSILMHLDFGFRSLPYSVYSPLLVASFYISPKRFEV
ncbi:glycosyltransferase family 2 protein [Flavitalea antarctica]